MAAMAHGFRFSSKKAAAFLTFRATAVTSKSLARYTTKSNNIKNKRSATTVARATQLPRPDIRKLAQLSKVKLTEEQIRDFQPKVDKVVDWYVKWSAFASPFFFFPLITDFFCVFFLYEIFPPPTFLFPIPPPPKGSHNCKRLSSTKQRYKTLRWLIVRENKD